MKPAEDIIAEELLELETSSDGWQTTYTYQDVIKLINIARKETIEECAEKAKSWRLRYGEQMGHEVDKKSILSLIDELK